MFRRSRVREIYGFGCRKLAMRNDYNWAPAAGSPARSRLMQTGENYETVPTQYSASLGPARPALEGRIAFWHKFDDIHRVEFGSGFHTSTTHVAGSSVPSRIASLRLAHRSCMET